MIGCLPTQTLAFLVVFVHATHATQAIAFEWKPGLAVGGCRSHGRIGGGNSTALSECCVSSVSVESQAHVSNANVVDDGDVLVRFLRRVRFVVSGSFLSQLQRS